MTLYVSLAAAALFAIGMSVLCAVALGRAAAHEDDLLEGEAHRLLTRRSQQLAASERLPRQRAAAGQAQLTPDLHV